LTIRIKNKIIKVFRIFARNFRILGYNQIDRKIQNKNLTSKLSKTDSNLDVFTHNTTKIRSVEVNEKDRELKTIVVTCYFTLKPDPQTGLSRNAADFKYIEPWYYSLLKTGANGIILHDGLEQEFISKHQTSQIQFRFCEMGNYSIFEERWLLYHLLLRQLPQLEKVFFTDSNDVYITQNPFPLITNETALYVGRDNANRIKDSGWLKEECSRFLEESNYTLPKTYEYQWVYNAGVTGGSYPVMLFLTSEMAMLIFKATSNYHKDMTLLNIVIHEHFYPLLSKENWDQQLVDTRNDVLASHSNLITGYPFNSGFKDLDLNSKAYFIHK
jgi:hypothetical protein